jgi:hypothetical protein
MEDGRGRLSYPTCHTASWISFLSFLPEYKLLGKRDQVLCAIGLRRAEPTECVELTGEFYFDS